MRLWLAIILLLVLVPTLFAQEQMVDHYSVRLGIMSWEDIQSEVDEEANSLSAYQRRMSKQMAEMHGGGMRGDYHVLVAIDDVVSGQRIEDAEVEVVVSNKDRQSETARLEQMVMDGFPGYGGFIRYNFEEPYSILISFKRASVGETGQVEFSTLP